MRRQIGYALVGVTVAVAVAAGTLSAYADWMIGGTAQVKVSNADMPSGPEPTVEARSKEAVVRWSAQEIAPGVKMDRYTVKALSQDAPARPTVVREVTASGDSGEAITFDADVVAGGTWKWTIVPHFAKWVGAAGPASTTLEFDPAPVVAAVAPAPATAQTIAAPSATSAPAPAQPTTTGSPTEPGAEPSITSPPPLPEKTEDKTPPPTASVPVESEPATGAPGPSASGSVGEDIPK